MLYQLFKFQKVDMKDYFKQASFQQHDSCMSATAVNPKSVNKYQLLLLTSFNTWLIKLTGERCSVKVIRGLMLGESVTVQRSHC